MLGTPISYLREDEAFKFSQSLRQLLKIALKIWIFSLTRKSNFFLQGVEFHENVTIFSP